MTGSDTPPTSPRSMGGLPSSPAPPAGLAMKRRSPWPRPAPKPCWRAQRHQGVGGAGANGLGGAPGRQRSLRETRSRLPAIGSRLRGPPAGRQPGHRPAGQQRRRDGAAAAAGNGRWLRLQFGTNYLGHFALTARLLPLLRRAAKPRVVNVSSVAARQGAIALDDLQSARTYVPMRAYAQTKLAMLIFALELQRRSNAHGWGLISNAAHPGWARTDIIPTVRPRTATSRGSGASPR